MNAHDVRHLCACQKCGQLGDDREMIVWREQMMHRDCAYQHLGRRVLDLPVEERGKFRLCDVPVAVMRIILERADRP